MAHMDTAEVSLEKSHSDSRVEGFVDGRRWTEACHVHLGRSCVGLIRGANSRVFAVSSVWHTLSGRTTEADNTADKTLPGPDQENI